MLQPMAKYPKGARKWGPYLLVLMDRNMLDLLYLSVMTYL